MSSLVIALLQEVGSSTFQWSNLLEVPNLIGAISALAAAIGTAVTVLVSWPSWKQWRTSRLLAKNFGSEFYSPEIIRRSTKYYILPNCSSIDPSYESEMRNVVVTEEKLFDVLDRFLERDSKYRHLLLLADSGMGKSSCLLNYYARNQGRRDRRRLRLAVVPLGTPKADDRIRSIEDKQNTVLFLDAFDEDTKAIQDHKERLRQLMDMAGEFKRVVITCRTQFFLRDEEIPRETGVVRVEPRRGGEKGVYEFQKLYLSPLSDRQVETYLKKRYPLWRWAKRRKARELVRAVPLLSVRPMLLAYIPDLLESGAPIRNSYDLYDALVSSWLERESRWVEKDSLQKLSEHLAVDVYCNREKRGAEWVEADELASLAKQWGVSLERWQLTGRSLLNRDAAGHCKFAHRSIMEFLFVKRYLAGDALCRGITWTDRMREFLLEMVRSGKLAQSPLLEDALKISGSLSVQAVVRLLEQEGSVVGLQLGLLFVNRAAVTFQMGTFCLRLSPDDVTSERWLRASVLPGCISWSTHEIALKPKSPLPVPGSMSVEISLVVLDDKVRPPLELTWSSPVMSGDLPSFCKEQYGSAGPLRIFRQPSL